MHLRVIILSLAAVLLASVASAQTLPKPQIASAAGKLAPDFTLKDQHGKVFRLSGQRGRRVLLLFYRGSWWPYCTAQLREFAQHKKDFDAVRTRVVAISTDDQADALQVWNKVVDRQFTILSDPGARVIHTYGVAHVGGGGADDIALDTALLVDTDGRERWRRVSTSLPDLPASEEVLQRIRQTPSQR